MARIKEASERKAAEGVKVKAARMNKRLAKAIQQRDLAELEPVLKEAKAKKVHLLSLPKSFFPDV